MISKNGVSESQASSRNPFSADGLDLAGVMLRRWPFVAGGVIVGLAAATAYFFLASTKYESSAQVLVMKKDSSLPTRGAESSGERSSEVSEDLMATHMQIVQSPAIIHAALKKHNLMGLPSIERRLAADENEVEYIIDHLKVTRGGSGQAKLANVLNVSFRHVSDVDSEHVLSAIVESYQDFLNEKFQDVSKEAVKLLAELKDQIAKDLEVAELDYQHFREAAPLLWNGDTSTNAPRQNYERLQNTISELDVERAAAKTRLETVEKTMAGLGDKVDDLDLLSLIDDSHVARLELLVEVKTGSAQTEEFQRIVPGLTASTRTEHEGMLPLSLKEQTLLADYGPEHPLVQDVRAQLTTAREFVAEKRSALKLKEIGARLDPEMLVAAYTKLLRNDLKTLDNRQAELRALSSKEEAAAKELVFAELKGETLRTNVKRKQDLYDAAIDRLRELHLVADYGKLITEVIAPVELGEKVWPKAPWALLIGGVLGLMLGGGAALGAEQLDRSFRNEEDVRSTIELPVLTRLVHLKTPPPVATDSPMDASLVAYHRPKSREAEAFRGLRTAIFFGSRGRRQQIIMCTSANPGDGKTLLNTNLAISIAQSGRKVLLVDADMRRPRVHQLFGLNNTGGLSAVLRGEIDPPDAVQNTVVENLWCVPCGESPSNPAELLASPRFEECLQVYREKYDFIVVDCPPVLAVADPCIIAPLADAVLMAVRLMKDMRSQVVRAKEQLAGVNAPLLGVFVNGIGEGGKIGGRYGYGSYGAYAYGYGSGGGKYYDDENSVGHEAPNGRNGNGNGRNGQNGHTETAGPTNGHS